MIYFAEDEKPNAFTSRLLPSVRQPCTLRNPSSDVCFVPSLTSQRYCPMSSMAMSVMTSEASLSSAACRKTRFSNRPKVLVFVPTKSSTSSNGASSFSSLVHRTWTLALGLLGRSRQGRVALPPNSAKILTGKDVDME